MKTLSNRYLTTLLLSMTAQVAVADQFADPTRPADTRVVATSETQGAIRVEGILRSGERRLAIVNGKLLRAGDRLGNTQILEILPDGIRYVRDGHNHTARLVERTMQVRRNVPSQKDAP